jgi:DNA polymerase III subunit alpha
VLTPVREWSKRERLDAERESLGLCLTGHFFDEVAEHCRHFTHGSLAKLLGSLPSAGTPYQTRRDVTVCRGGLGRTSSRRPVSIELDDNTDRIEVSLFDEVYAQCRHLITKHAVLVINGQLRYDDFLSAWRVTAQRVRSVDEAIEEYARRLTIRLNGGEASGELVHTLKDTLKPFTHGDCLVCVQYEGRGAGALLTLGDAWRVRPTRELRENLTRLLGEDHYSIHYPGHLL